MAFIYEGIDVDKPAAGFSGAPTTVIRANNIIVIANERIKYYTSIATSYNSAYKALADFKSANPDQRAPGYSFATYTKLQLEVDKWKAIVIRNGGKLKSAGSAGGHIGDQGQAEADFSAKITKYNQDIFKSQSTINNYKSPNNPNQSPLPSPDQVMGSIVADARAANDAAVAGARQEAQAAFNYQNSLKDLTNPNKVNKDSFTPGNITNVLNNGLASKQLVWNLTTLGLAATLVPDGNKLSNTDLSKIARELPKEATLDQVKGALAIAAKSLKSRSIPKPAPTKNAALKPSSAVIAQTNPPKPPKPDPVSNNVKALTNPGRR